MRVDKVISSICSVILILHLVNAKTNSSTKHRHKYTSQQIPEAAKKIQNVARQNDDETDQQNDQKELNAFDNAKSESENEQLKKAQMSIINNNIQDLNELDTQAKNMIAIAATMTTWQYGIVPYRMNESTFDALLKTRIKKAMDIIEAASCVRFKEISEPTEGVAWLHFTNPDRTRECIHEATEGKNDDLIIVLGFECLKIRDIIHSILHGLGFKDEVTHPHRDQYIRILWENVQPKYRNLFSIRRDDTHKLVEYDPMSIMHFHSRAYSVNGGLTISPVINGLVINPSDKLSQLDVMKLRLTFGHECNKRKVGDILQNCKNVLYNKTLETHHNVESGEDNEEENDVSDTVIHKVHSTSEEKNEEGSDIAKQIDDVYENPKDNEHGGDHDESIKKDEKTEDEHKTDEENKPKSQSEEDVARLTDDVNEYSDSIEKEHSDKIEEEHKSNEKNKPEVHSTEKVTNDPVSDVDPLEARRFPIHLKFKNIH